jgi:hypothetical protein
MTLIPARHHLFKKSDLIEINIHKLMKSNTTKTVVLKNGIRVDLIPKLIDNNLHICILVNQTTELTPYKVVSLPITGCLAEAHSRSHEWERDFVEWNGQNFRYLYIDQEHSRIGTRKELNLRYYLNSLSMKERRYWQQEYRRTKREKELKKERRFERKRVNMMHQKPSDKI